MAVTERRKKAELVDEVSNLASAVRGLNMTLVRMDERLAKAQDEQRQFTKDVLAEIRAALKPPTTKDDD